MGDGNLWLYFGEKKDNDITEKKYIYLKEIESKIIDYAEKKNLYEHIQAKKYLNSKFSNLFTVSIPKLKDLENIDIWEQYRYERNIYMPDFLFFTPKNEICKIDKYCIEKDMSLEWKDIELHEKEIILEMQTHKQIIKDEKAYNTIFLIGPCIVNGWNQLEKDSLAYILQQKLKEKKLHYNIVRILSTFQGISGYRSLLEKNIRKKDIIFWILPHIKNADIDLLELFNSRDYNNWYFQNEPIHTTALGNRKIVDILFPYIEKIIRTGSEENDYIQFGVPQLAICEKNKLDEWIKK